MSVELLDARDKGQFPVSIGTSLGLEGLFGIFPERVITEGPVPYTDYAELWINFRTLFRNLWSCFKAADAAKLEADDIATALIEEMTLIRNAVSDRSAGTLQTQFYVCSYKSLSGLYKFAQFKDITTPVQTHYAEVENKAAAKVFEVLGTENEFLKACDTSVDLPHAKVVLMTNFPIDLINAKHANELALLESHTGVIKKKAKWNTKLNNGKALERMPFDRMTVQLFGDSGHLFIPYPRDYRDFLVGLAEKHKWHSLTTKDRILQCVRLERNPTYEAKIRQLYGL